MANLKPGAGYFPEPIRVNPEMVVLAIPEDDSEIMGGWLRALRIGGILSGTRTVGALLVIAVRDADTLTKWKLKITGRYGFVSHAIVCVSDTATGELKHFLLVLSTTMKTPSGFTLDKLPYVLCRLC